MSRGPDPLTERKDAFLLAALSEVPFEGWSGALAAAARAQGLADHERQALFPGGLPDLLAWFSHWADRQALKELAGLDLARLKVRERITAGVRARLAALKPHREAVRRALGTFVSPLRAPQGARLLYDTVDALWYAAGDAATDFNFYTKRALLAAVYAATTLYWLEDRSPDAAETHAFLERRLADVMAIPRAGERLRGVLGHLPNPLAFFAPPRPRF